MPYAPDIEARIDSRFKDGNRVRAILAQLSTKEEERVVRCILVISEADIDAVEVWVRNANTDYRDIIWNAEYDNRNVRKFDFTRPFETQIPYSYKE